MANRPKVSVRLKLITVSADLSRVFHDSFDLLHALLLLIPMLQVLDNAHCSRIFAFELRRSDKVTGRVLIQLLFTCSKILVLEESYVARFISSVPIVRDFLIDGHFLSSLIATSVLGGLLLLR